MRSGLRASASAWLRMVLVAVSMLGVMGVASEAKADPVNLVQNGTFTNTTLTGTGGFLCDNSGGSACTSHVANWSGTCSTVGCSGTSTPSSVLFAGTNGSAWNGGFGLYWNGNIDPPLGGNTLAIDGDPKYTSVLSQSISGLQLGHSYMLQFYQAASQQVGLSGATTEQWQVGLGGGVSQTSDLMQTPSKGSHGWMLETMSFIATAATETLQFVALGTPNGEPPVCLLGDVSLFDNTPVPEPATLALVGVGLLALGIVRKRAAAL